MSIILRPEIEPTKASLLTLIAGLAVAKAVNQIIGIKAYIKWPNDIIINNKKAAGILTEMSAEMDQIHYVVVGIGINVNTKEFDESLKNIATSLLIENHKTVHRATLVRKILEIFEKYYEQFQKINDISLFLDEYNKMCITINREVKVIKNNETLIGLAKTITNQGELIIVDKQGIEYIIQSGEVSVRGIVEGDYI